MATYSTSLGQKIKMDINHFKYQKVKKKYLKFISSQEVLSEPFRDKLSQFNKFYLPLSKMIKEEYLKNEKIRDNFYFSISCVKFNDRS